MLLRREYTLTAPKNSLAEPEFPIEFALQGGRHGVITESENDALWHMSVTEPVTVADLRLVEESGWTREDESGSRLPVPAIEVRSEAAAETRVLARSIASALTFLFDKPVGFSVRPHADEFIPETAEEQELLDRWGTRKTYSPWSISTSGGSVSGRVDGEDITRILPQQAGLRLYEEAVRADTPTARFRDLWRVLESAFARKDQALVDLLATFPPLESLGVDIDELTKLLILRGRASHAQSKAGLLEVTQVEHACRKHVARLKTIVEHVIETKQSWGYPTTGHEGRLRPGRRRPDTERPVEPSGEIALG